MPSEPLEQLVLALYRSNKGGKPRDLAKALGWSEEFVESVVRSHFNQGRNWLWRDGEEDEGLELTDMGRVEGFRLAEATKAEEAAASAAALKASQEAKWSTIAMKWGKDRFVNAMTDGVDKVLGFLLGAGFTLLVTWLTGMLHLPNPMAKPDAPPAGPSAATRGAP